MRGVGTCSMEFFKEARTVRLRGHHGKYLWADDDEFKISQNKEGKNERAMWRVQEVPDSNMIRLKSCHNTFLTASDDDFLLGMTGKKTVQSRVEHLDSSVEWEPIKEGSLVKLKTCHGNFLRANNGLPPWRSSVTHDLPQRFHKHQEFLLWEVENVSVSTSIRHAEVQPPQVPQKSFASHAQDLNSISSDSLSSGLDSRTSSVRSDSRSSSQREGHVPWVTSHLSPRKSFPKPVEGRDIFYTVADEIGKVKEVKDGGWSSFKFKGHSLKLLQERLHAETQIDDEIILCTRHQNKLVILRLGLPPNNAAVYIVVVPESSPLAATLSDR